jgi:hypothetical protein
MAPPRVTRIAMGSLLKLTVSWLFEKRKTRAEGEKVSSGEDEEAEAKFKECEPDLRFGA